MIYIDGENAVLGRTGTKISKALLAGESVLLYNCEKMRISGSLAVQKAKLISHRSQTDKRTPAHSPHWPRVPNLLVRRMLRGMLPWDSQRGRDAYKRLHVQIGAPATINEKITKMEGAKKELGQSFSVLQLSEALGYQYR
ncbi:uL13 family ribosomal protein [Candidatus Micrarchaeota archaeon]|nr:uL13 family ribosomal protein [Candidatus Micrarchaeota archaeon]